MTSKINVGDKKPAAPRDTGGSTQHKLWYNKVQDFAYMQLVQELSRDDILTLFSALDRVFGTRAKHRLLIDMRLCPGTAPDKQLRDLFKERARQIGLDRIAVLGADAMSRMSLKIILAVLGKTSATRFCMTEMEAMLWLRGAHNGAEEE